MVAGFAEIGETKGLHSCGARLNQTRLTTAAAEAILPTYSATVGWRAFDAHTFFCQPTEKAHKTLDLGYFSRLHRVRNGKILVLPVGQPNPKPVPSGLIHDWLGAAFIPNARIEDILLMVRHYDDYKDFYKPALWRPCDCANRPIADVSALREVPYTEFT